MSIAIRKASLSDASRLAALHRHCFDQAWDEAAFRAFLENPAVVILLAGGAAANESQAFIAIQAAGGEAEILSLGTLPPARRLGLARLLVREASSEAATRGAREMFLDVAEDNAPALALYRNAGFSVLGRRKSYYPRASGRPVDALSLRAILPL